MQQPFLRLEPKRNPLAFILAAIFLWKYADVWAQFMEYLFRYLGVTTGAMTIGVLSFIPAWLGLARVIEFILAETIIKWWGREKTASQGEWYLRRFSGEGGGLSLRGVIKGLSIAVILGVAALALYQSMGG